MVTYVVLRATQEFASIRLSPDFMGVMARCSDPPGLPKDLDLGLEYPVDAQKLLSQVVAFLQDLKSLKTVSYSFKRVTGKWKSTFSGATIKIGGEMFLIRGGENHCALYDHETREAIDLSGVKEFSDAEGVIRVIKRSARKHPEVREFESLARKLREVDPETTLIVLLA